MMSEVPRALQRPERFAAAPTPPYRPAFIEKLLLAILDANAPGANAPGGPGVVDREARVDQALKILLGHKRKRGRPEAFDLPVLFDLWGDEAMVRTLNILYDPEQPAPTFEELLKRLPKMYKGGSTAEVLAHKYPQHKWYFDLAGDWTSPSLPEEKEIYQDLLVIAGICKKYNLELKIDPLKLGLVSVLHPNQLPEADTGEGSE